MNRLLFYKIKLKKLIKEREAKILIIAGGQNDKKVLMDLGFKNVTISNLDTRMNENEYKPYKWSFQDAENLTFKDEEFDYAIIHQALHHCKSPHRALLEMYRVSKKGAFVTVDAYNNEEEKKRMFSWNLTAKTILSTGQWKSLLMLLKKFYY